MTFKLGTNGHEIDAYLIDGELLSRAEIALKFGISKGTLASRMRRNPDKQITELLHSTTSKKRKGMKMYTYKGVTKSCAEWAKHLNTSLSGMRNRIVSWGIERAIEQPIIGRRDKVSRWSKPIPDVDNDYELSNRINSYRKLGWSDDEILTKITNGDYQLDRTLSV